MTITRLGYALTSALMILSGPAIGQGFKPLRYEMRAYAKTDNKKRSESTRVWIAAADKYRIEQEAGAQTIITIANGVDVWELRPLQNAALHSKENAQRVVKVGKQAYGVTNMLGAFVKQGGKRAGQAKIEGILCTAYTRKDASGMRYAVWIQPDGKIRRMASSGTLRGAITLGAPIETHLVEQRVDYKWLAAERMDEALFRPPVGVSITERAPSK